jgi:acetylornithine deacetylase/succinyl-diaminopimelate desuccinylase
MRNADVVKLTSDLVNIRSDSENTGEREVSRYIRDYLQGLGIPSEITEFAKGRCSVTASVGKGDGLMLNGHTDTVPTGSANEWRYGVEAKAVNGRLYGRGTSDMKGGVAAILAAIPDLNLSRAKRRLVFAFVADEEVEFRGSKWLIKNRKEIFKNVKYGVIAEPTDLHLQVAQKGIASISVKVKGMSAHGSTPELGRNAIVDMSRFIVALEKLPQNLKTEDELLGRGVINVGTINGGTAINVVPDHCEIKIDRRLVPGETAEIAAAQVKKILDSVNIDYRLEVSYSRPPYRLSENVYILKFLSEIIPGKHIGATGYTEAELYKSMANIDCAVLGPGTMSIAHKPNEYVSISNLAKSKECFSRMMQKWCSGDGPRSN